MTKISILPKSYTSKMSLHLFPTAKFRKVTNELKVPFRIKVVILFVKLLHPDRPFLPLKLGDVTPLLIQHFSRG